MLNRKSILAGVLATTLTLTLTACGTTTPTDPTTSGGSGTQEKPVNAQTVKVAFNQSDAHPQYKALVEMGEKFAATTAGAYAFDVQPNELLGDQRSTVELVQTGAIQMSMVGNPLVENFNKDFAVIGLPYVYDSSEHQKEVFTSGVLDELFASTKTNDFEVVTAFTAGARCIYTDKAIKTPADLKGYKIRVMESDTMIKMLGFMGGIGTPMGQGEVYTAIQQGVLEGGENNEITYADLKHYEVAPFFSYTSHLMVPDLLIANTTFLDSMTDEHKTAFDALAKETTEREFTLWNERIESAKQTAIDGGATFVEVDIAPFQENCKSLAEAVAGSSETAGKLYETVRGLAK